jgi:predicted Zn-dependent protease
MSQREDLPSVILTAAVLVAVLVGSFVFAATQLTGNESDEAGFRRSTTAGLACQLPDDCRVPSQALTRAYGDTTACDGTGARVCLVPMGDVSKDLVDAIVAHYRSEYGLAIHVAKPISLPTGFERATQLEESRLHKYMLDAYPKLAGDKNVTLIGILPVDIYLRGQQWEWGFGRLRGEPGTGGGIDYRQAIVSTWRMDPRNLGERPDTELRNQRVIKLLSKYIAMAYYNLPLTNDPTSVTYNNITDVDDLDRVSERIPGR